MGALDYSGEASACCWPARTHRLCLAIWTAHSRRCQKERFFRVHGVCDWRSASAALMNTFRKMTSGSCTSARSFDAKSARSRPNVNRKLRGRYQTNPLLHQGKLIYDERTDLSKDICRRDRGTRIHIDA